MPISATTELLGEHPELLDIAIADIEDGQITSWVRGGDGLIGFGVYKSHIVKGPDRFQKARSWWRAEINSLNIANNAHSSGSGPILFTSFSFDEAEDSILIIPKVVVGQSNGKSWITWIGDG
ncbi:MAG: isochorismate synthase, partial [Actinobacteria bacterium]|nr:isochorismate synthase [Actinomycetota bacterium]